MNSSKSRLFLSLLLTFAISSSSGQSSGSAPTGLLCDLVSDGNFSTINGYLSNQSRSGLADAGLKSVLIFNKRPAFSWMQPSGANGAVQTAYQILVSEQPAQLAQNIGDVWDSGKVLDNKSSGIGFAGTALKPNTRYYWKLRVWNTDQKISPFSSASSFLTAPELSEYKNPAYPLEVFEQKPISLTTINGVYQADFGKDAFGQLKVQLFSRTDNDTVEVHLGEILGSNGRINAKPPGTIRYAKYKLALQRGIHTYKLNIYKDNFNTRPAAVKMPEHIGEVTPFRYCEIENYANGLKNDDLTRLMVHYKFDESASSFHSSDSTLNSIWQLCKYSIKATSFLGIYVDGDRERIPYEADAYINQLSHYAVDKEFTIARNTHEHLITNPTWPTEWNLQSVLMAWNDYLYTGDIRSVAHYYKDLQAKTLSSLTDSTGLISTLNGRLNDEVKASIHLSGKLQDIVDWPLKTETDGFVFTKYNAVVNAFHYRTLIIMEQLATDLGKIQDANLYRQQASSVKKAFQKMFFDPERGIYVDGIGTNHASLHANAFALALGLVDAKKTATVMQFIRSRGMACSVYGSQFLLDGIYDANEAGYGLSLLTSKTDRSWYNMIRVGSTITLEAWDNKYKPNQDWNHAWGAAPANVISRKVMGIEPMAPGWSLIRIKPQIANLENASILVPTIKGPIKANYRQTRDAFTMEVEIPVNTFAEVHLPLKEGKKYQVLLDGKSVKITKRPQAAILSRLGSGQHRIQISYKD